MRLSLSGLASSLLAAAALLTMPHAVSAQTGTASLSGTVTDAQKSAVPGATVTITSAATGLSREAVTGGNGGYQFIALPPGVYTLKAELTGFKTSIIEKIQLSTDTSSRVDVALAVGGIEESVQVLAEAPAINTTDASLGNVIKESQIMGLPLEARNPVGLLSLQAGVVYIPRNNPETTMDPRYGSVSGARADQSNVTLDGIDVNDGQNQSAFTSVLRLTLDSVQEFRVTTSSYGADGGRSSGPQVSLITKSGTNSLRGAGYYANRDTRFSSNEYFNKLSQLKAGGESESPLLNKNIYGGSVGGPILRDRLFYFANFEALREKRESVVERSVPSAAMRDGVLTYLCAVAAACPGGAVQGFTSTHTIPAGRYGMNPAEFKRVDPTGIGASTLAAEYWKQFPLPNYDGTDAFNIMGYRFTSLVENEFNTGIARGDYRITNAQSLFARFNSQDDALIGTQQYPGLAPNTARQVKNWGFASGHDWVLGSNMVNTLRVGYTKIDDATTGLQTQSATTFRFLDNYEALSSTNGRQLGTWNVTNDFSWIKGNHTVKVGTNLRFLRNDTFTNANSFYSGLANGSWAAGAGRRYMPGGTCPAPADCSGLPAVDSGSFAAYADPFMDMLGAITQTTARYNYTIDGGIISEGTALPRLYVANEYEFYVQDQWRIGDNFTLTGASLQHVPAGVRGAWPAGGAQPQHGRLGCDASSQHAAWHPFECGRDNFVHPGRARQRRPRLVPVRQEQLRTARQLRVVAQSEDDRPRRLLPGLRPHRLGSCHSVQHRRIVRTGVGLEQPRQHEQRDQPGDPLPGSQRHSGDLSRCAAGLVPGHATAVLGHHHVGDRPEPAHAVFARLQPDVQP